MIVTDSAELAEKCRGLRNLCFDAERRYIHEELGWNFRMSNITAALGVAQLKKTGKIITMRRKNAAYLTRKLSDIREIIPPLAPKGYMHVYQMYTIRLKKGNRDGLLKYLGRNGVTAKVFFHPVHMTQFYREKLGHRARLPVTERVSRQVLTLPMYPSLTVKEIDFIAEKIHYFFERE
jgi:perosamine synthetase